MDNTRLKAGMIVDCLDQPLGTLVAVRGDDAAPVLVVRSKSSQEAELLIPAQYVARVEGNQVHLNLGCADATLLGSSAGTAKAVASGETLAVPLISETLTSATHWQEAGAVEVRKTTHTITQELDVPRRYETADLQRVPVNRVLADNEVVEARQEGETLIVPVIHEEVIAVKRRVLVEEIRITKQVHTTTEHIAAPVLREEVEIAHTGLEAHGPGSSAQAP